MNKIILTNKLRARGMVRGESFVINTPCSSNLMSNHTRGVSTKLGDHVISEKIFSPLFFITKWASSQSIRYTSSNSHCLQENATHRVSGCCKYLSLLLVLPFDPADNHILDLNKFERRFL